MSANRRLAQEVADRAAPLFETLRWSLDGDEVAFDDEDLANPRRIEDAVDSMLDHWDELDLDGDDEGLVSMESGKMALHWLAVEDGNYIRQVCLILHEDVA